IVIGIEDKTRKIIGLKKILYEEERLASAITDSITPLLMPDIEVYTYRNKELILVHVPHATGPFYLTAKGPQMGTYVRLGSTNRIADTEMYQALQNFAR